MKCSGTGEMLSAYANDELSISQRESVVEHLLTCADCRAALEEYVAIRQRLTALREMPLLLDITEATMQRIKTVDESKNAVTQKTRLALMAVPVVVIVITLIILQPWDSSLGPQRVLARAYTAFSEAQSFRMELSVSGTSEEEGNIEGTGLLEYGASNNFHSKWVVNGELVGELVEELIVVGDQIYSRVAGTYGNPDYSFFIPSREKTQELLQSLINVELLPDETIGGTDCFHYRGMVDFTRGAKELIAQLDPEDPHYETTKEGLERSAEHLSQLWKQEFEIWIGKDDYLLRREIGSFQVTSPDTGELEFTYTMTTRYYDFNQPIVIEPPVDENGEVLPGWRLLQ